MRGKKRTANCPYVVAREVLPPELLAELEEACGHTWRRIWFGVRPGKRSKTERFLSVDLARRVRDAIPQADWSYMWLYVSAPYRTEQRQKARLAVVQWLVDRGHTQKAAVGVAHTTSIAAREADIMTLPRARWRKVPETPPSPEGMEVLARRVSGVVGPIVVAHHTQEQLERMFCAVSPQPLHRLRFHVRAVSAALRDARDNGCPNIEEVWRGTI